MFTTPSNFDSGRRRSLPSILPEAWVLWAAVAALGLPQVPAFAGPNAGGTLILAQHMLGGTCWDYCEYEDPLCGDHRESCDDFVIRWDETGPNAVKVYAAFDETAVPSLASVSFGIDHAGNELDIVVFAGEGCGQSFELTGNWPEPGSGARVTFDPPRTDQFIGLFYMAAYSYYGNGGTVSLTPHPSLPAVFEDGSVPPLTDEIVDYGAFGFFEDGYLPCPAPVLGACCIGLDCQILSYGACALASGEYQGDDIPCDPETCEPVPVVETSWGRIKDQMR